MKLNTADFLHMARFYHWTPTLDILSSLAIQSDSSAAPATGQMKTFFQLATPSTILCISNQTINYLIVCKDPGVGVAQVVTIRGKMSETYSKVNATNLRKMISAMLKLKSGAKIEQKKVGIFNLNNRNVNSLWVCSLTTDSWIGTKAPQLTQEIESYAMKHPGITTTQLVSSIVIHIFRDGNGNGSNGNSNNTNRKEKR